MIIGYETLKEHFGGNSPADTAARMHRAGVKYLLGKNGRPFCTEAALNHAMSLPVAPVVPDNPENRKATVKVL